MKTMSEIKNMLNGINRLDIEQNITEPEHTAIDTTQNGKKKKVTD